MNDTTTPAAPLPRVILKARRAQPFFAGHPWVFSGAIQNVTGEPAPGAEVVVVTDRNEFVARGLYNPQSQIRVRLFSWDEQCPLDDAFWSRRLDAAIALRRDMLGLCGPTSACRLVFSEADGLSGLIVDYYAGWLLLQFTSLALSLRRDTIIRLLNDKLHPTGMWLRTEKGIREAEGLSAADGLLFGETPPRPIIITEQGLEFGVDVVEGQKTGYFMDQRDNRMALARYTAGRRVLDMFCYSGGFALYALKHGQASAALAIDGSESALALARANAERNGLADRITFEKSDAFKAMERLQAAGERFGVVVLDPPKLARHSAGVDDALRGYHSLNRLGVELLEPGGILLTCSCSGHVHRDDFESMLADVAARSKRPIQVLETRGAAADHPVAVQCPETSYLKCYICRVH